MPTTAGDIYVRSGTQGAFTEVKYVQGGWLTVDSSSTMVNIDVSRLQQGQLVFVESQNKFYKATVVLADYVTIFDDSASFSEYQFLTSSISNFDTQVSRSAAAAGFGAGGGATIPAGTVSSSAQTIANLNGTNILSGSILTSSITNFNTEVSRSAAASGFGASTLPSGVVSSSAQVSYVLISNVPSGIVSSSAQTIENLNGSGILSGSSSVPAGTISSSAQVVAALPVGTISSSAQILPILTSSVTNFDTEVSRSAATAGFGSSTLPSGVVSSSAQVISNLNSSGILSGSIPTSSVTNFDTEVSRSAAASGFGVGGGSVPAGTISSSTQVVAALPAGTVSSSAQILPILTSSVTNFDTEVSRSAAAAGFGVGGGTTDISALNTFTGSIQSEVNALKAATSSYVTSTQTSSFVTNSQTSSFALKTEISGAFTQDSASISTRLTSLEAGGGSVPAGTVSSSTQILGYNIFATTGSNTFNGTEIVSGSLNVSGSLIANRLTYPTQDGGFESQVLQTNAAGTLSFGDVTTLYESIFNGEATTLEKGTPVYVSGSNGDSPIVFRADAGNPSKMPVTYVVSENIGSGVVGRGIVLGLISGIDLTGYTAGQDVYVAVGGGWTSTRPTGSAIIQLLGVITKPGNGGQGLVLNPGVVTLPNLTAGSVWVGNNNAVPTATSTASLNVLSAQTASYVSPTFISASAAASGFGSATLPSGVVSSSAQVVAALPAGTVSSSAQILPILTSSVTNFDTEVSRSAAAAGFGSGGGASIPAGTVSSSAQTVANLVGQNVVVNTITAQQYVVSSSVSFITTSFSSGSTAFGDSLSDTHTFTGSISITGSLNIGGPFSVNNENLNVSSGSIILTNSSSIVVLDSGIISGTFVGNLNYNYITNLPNLISSSAQIAALGAGLLSSSAQIASDISGAFTSLSSSFASRITALEGAGGGSGIFTLTGSFYSTTNNVKITGSLSVGSGSFKSFEVDSNGFVVLGDMTKDLNTAPVGTIAYSGSDFYLIS